MRPSRARFSAPDASYRMPWSAACITNTFESEFSVHTAAKLFENHPHFAIFPGESVEIMPVLSIPGA
jgi:hypothetical protein